MDALVDLLEAFHAALDIERSVLIGFSLGGAVAQLFHARHPQRVIALGLISTAPNFALPDEVVARWQADPRAYAEDEPALSIAPMSSKAVREQIAALRAAVGPEGQGADLAACASWDSPADRLATRCPLFLMSASHDILRLREQAEEWAQTISGARLAIVPEAGHFMLVEQPEFCAGAVLDWLGTVNLALRGRAFGRLVASCDEASDLRRRHRARILLEGMPWDEGKCCRLSANCRGGPCCRPADWRSAACSCRQQ